MKKLKTRGFLSQQAAELAKNFCQKHSKIKWMLFRSVTFFKCNCPGGACTRLSIADATHRWPSAITCAFDELVWRDLCEVLSHPDELARALEQAHGGHWLPQELQARRENLRKGRTSLSQQLNRPTKAYLHSIIPLLEYKRRRRELEQRDRALMGGCVRAC